MKTDEQVMLEKRALVVNQLEKYANWLWSQAYNETKSGNSTHYTGLMRDFWVGALDHAEDPDTQHALLEGFFDTFTNKKDDELPKEVRNLAWGSPNSPKTYIDKGTRHELAGVLAGLISDVDQ